MTTIELTPETLKGQLDAGRLLLDFYAPWCSACKTLDKVIDSAAGELPEDLVIGKVDVDQFPLLAAEYGVTNLPRLLLFQNGKLVAESGGFVSAGKLKEFVKR